MAVFGKIAFGVALLSALLLPDIAGAASSSPKIVIPPRNSGHTVCDSRGCFGFGPQQWYRRPGYAVPNTPGLNDRSRIGRPVTIPPRTNYVPPKTNFRAPVDNRTRHQTWCAEHYRSYNPGTDRYTSLHNGSQVCRSPYY